MNSNLTRDQLEAILTKLSNEDMTSPRNVVDELVDEWFFEDVEATPAEEVDLDIINDRFGMYVMKVYEQDYDTIVYRFNRSAA